MKILCGLKTKTDNDDSLSGCFSSPKKKGIIRIYKELNNIEKKNVYLILEDYHTSTGFQLFKGDYVLKCFEHTFGLVGLNETSVTIPIFKDDYIIYTSFIAVPKNILAMN
jgi:hypothetical protein